jgi:hypothetical protein
MVRIYVPSVVTPAGIAFGARARFQRRLTYWYPVIAGSQIEGDEPAAKSAVFAVSLLRNGNHVHEKLLGLSDHDMCRTYSIESTMAVNNYIATPRLATVNGSQVAWPYIATGTRDWMKLDVVERPAPTASKC